MKVPSFNGDPSAWPMFIQMFKIFIHDAVSSDAERIAHLHDALTPEISKNIGGAFLNPGLYNGLIESQLVIMLLILQEWANVVVAWRLFSDRLSVLKWPRRVFLRLPSSIWPAVFIETLLFVYTLL
jgi:hypothetical protein